MITIVKEAQEKSTALPLYHWNDMKSRLSIPVEDVAECTCSARHMSVHDAMCPNCWAKLMERSGH